jgi:hypothetical protein
MYTLLFLTIFYVYQDPSRETFREDYSAYWFFTTRWMFSEIYGRSWKLSFFDDSFKRQLEDPTLKFYLLCDIDIYYDKSDNLEQDKRDYQTMYKNIHFHYRPGWRISRKEKDINTQPSIDQNIREGVPYQGLKSSSLKNGFPVKNIAEIDQSYICPSCKLVLREPYRLNCGHQLCQSCINPQNT